MRRKILLSVMVLCMTMAVAGVAFAATRTCTGGTCEGTNREDLLYGSTGFDQILAYDGDDEIRADEGDDMVKGGNGDDYVYGEGGNDRVKGSRGRDHVFGGEGDDLVRGGLHGKTNDGVKDVLDCGPGNDTVLYVKGQDTIENCEVLNPKIP